MKKIDEVNGKPLSAIYRGACDILRTKGWAQNTMRAKSGGRCALGALYEAAGFDPTTFVAAEHSAAIVAPINEHLRHYAGGDGTVVWWNDYPGRSKEDVISELSIVAVRLQKEGR